jgi:hypothetical protein
VIDSPQKIKENVSDIEENMEDKMMNIGFAG